MEYYYTAYSKMIQDQKFYFVKKIMHFSEFKGVSDFLDGYGMHTNFDKACDFAGITDLRVRKNLLNEIEETIQPAKVIGINQSIAKTGSR